MLRLTLSRSAFQAGLLAVLLSTRGTVGHAAPIRYEYGGTITSADPLTGVVPGTRFSGNFTYDPASKPTALVIEGSSQYFFGNSAPSVTPVADGSGITLQIGSQVTLSESGGLTLSVAQQQYAGQWGYTNADGTGAGPSTDVGIGNSSRTAGDLHWGVNLSNPTPAFGRLTRPRRSASPTFPWLRSPLTTDILVGRRRFIPGPSTR